MSPIRPILIELPDELVGPRVRLRPYVEADAPGIFEAVDESRTPLGEWMPWVKDYHSVDDALANTRRFRARWLLREDLIVGIFERDRGRSLMFTIYICSCFVYNARK